MNRDKQKQIEARRRYVRQQRFLSGLRELRYHRIKSVIPVAYLLATGLIWFNCGVLLAPIFNDYFLLYVSISITFILVGIVLLVGIVVLLGTPLKSNKIRTSLIETGFVNSSNLPPLLLSIHKGDGDSRIYEFDLNNLPLSRWEQDKDKIGAALKVSIVRVRLSADGSRVFLHAIPAQFHLPEKLYWRYEYLSKEDFVLTLGMNLMGTLESFDLAKTPHVLIGGGSGSGKSVLTKCLLMQCLQKGAVVTLADFKGGVDYSGVWHQKCKMVFDPQSLLAALEELTAELERRRGLFVTAGTHNLIEYNKSTGENLSRHIFACDEIAEILDTTGLDKSEKEVLLQIIKHLSLIARQGRAFGIHLILATQRPSADLIPGQIRTNLSLRICGRADDILSRIILDNANASTQILPDSQGCFLTNMGNAFQGFLFDEGILSQ